MEIRFNPSRAEKYSAIDAPAGVHILVENFNQEWTNPPCIMHRQEYHKDFVIWYEGNRQFPKIVRVSDIEPTARFSPLEENVDVLIQYTPESK